MKPFGSQPLLLPISPFFMVLLQHSTPTDASWYYRPSCGQWLKCWEDFYFFLTMFDD